MSSDRFDNNEWRKNSTKGLICGIMLCRNSPINNVLDVYFIIALNM
ncbi:MAG TPA: hypothetical protein VK882_07330 [Nitrososphaeraceae archaeon]|nr:hypothetical protein [Nitrososphaeraceae archaeon]